jgi:hypothetical protein
MVKIKPLPFSQTHSELCKEWDYDKNLKEFGITPNDITFGSHKVVWWICKDFSEHKWISSINYRTNHQF